MPTNEERREVAARLRKAIGLHEFAEVLGFDWTDESDWVWKDVSNLVADLIEPTCDCNTLQKVAEEMFGKMRHSTKEEADAYEAMLKSMSVEIHPVDRDALLALAVNLNARATELLKVNDLDQSRQRRSARLEHATDLMAACSRIREALGVK